jgi:type III secretory pathway component EscU
MRRVTLKRLIREYTEAAGHPPNKARRRQLKKQYKEDRRSP